MNLATLLADFFYLFHTEEVFSVYLRIPDSYPAKGETPS